MDTIAQIVYEIHCVSENAVYVAKKAPTLSNIETHPIPAARIVVGYNSGAYTYITLNDADDAHFPTKLTHRPMFSKLLEWNKNAHIRHAIPVINCAILQGEARHLLQVVSKNHCLLAITPITVTINFLREIFFIRKNVINTLTSRVSRPLFKTYPKVVQQFFC